MVVLVVSLLVFIVLAVTLVDDLRERLGRPAWLLEILIFVLLGVVWALPFRSLFRGIGRDDPDAPKPPKE